MIIVFLPGACDIRFVIHAETYITSKANPMENNMYQEEGVLIFHTQCCWVWIKDAQAFCSSICTQWTGWTKQLAVCIWEIQIWRKGGRIWALDLCSYQGSADFEALFIPRMDVGPSSSLLYLFLSTHCVLVRDSYGVVDWMFTGEPFGSHSTLTSFSFSFCTSLPFYHLSLLSPQQRCDQKRGGYWREPGSSRASQWVWLLLSWW